MPQSYSGTPSMSDHDSEPIRIALRGRTLLHDSRFNKGTGFPLDERKQFHLVGHLPHRVNTLEEQCIRAKNQLDSMDTPIQKNTFLQSVKEQNWVLYYCLLSHNLKELVPIIYTPTEAEAIANYSHLYRQSEGLYLSFPSQDTMEQDFLDQTRGREIDLIVCSDAEAILGIGDQGVGGIGISTSKSVIYTLLGGIDPSESLPVILDVGTDNQELLDDELYVGWPHNRVRGEEYDEFIDKFVQLVRKYYPHSLLHFEDFGVSNAHRILERYFDQHSVFNDDIQGTGAVTLACILSAIRLTPYKHLKDHRIVVYGAGSAGLGIARQLRDAMVVVPSINPNAPEVKDADTRFWLIDKEGLITAKLSAKGNVREDLNEFVREDWDDDKDGVGLLDVVRKVKPTILIGCSTHAGGFTQAVVEEMSARVERPIFLPLSNPSNLVEAHPKDIWAWSKGNALIATGSPFGKVGNTYEVAECNNALIYPGLGLGAIVSKSKRLTLQMITAGALRLADLGPTLNVSDYKGEPLLPDFDAGALQVNIEVAIAVTLQSIIEGSCGEEWLYLQDGKGISADERAKVVRETVEKRIWRPMYKKYVYDENGEN